ncbi:MAG TPA: AAA family ATPase [Candidatus Eisenbacteria bacterium]
MKIHALKADGFGALRGEFRFDPSRLNLVVGENERGKSTLLAAVTAALYGLEVDRRSHRVLTPAERWRPWDGGAYRLELEVEHAGERYTIRRDFESGTVEVWTADGQEVSERFRSGKESWPIGQHLFGLNVWEFEKCALVRQGELESVVPSDEKGRRSSTLHARLESAADTSVGDTNAVEAAQVLEAAAQAYNCVELGSTMRVETAIARLEQKRLALEGEIQALERDFEKLSGPFDDLVRLGEKEDGAREALARIDSERRETLAADVRRKLADNDERRRELDELRAEAAKLASAAKMPTNAEAELRETVARHEEAQRNLEQLETRRDEEQARERGSLAAELESLKAYASCAPEDADRLVAMASEIRRIAEEDGRARTAVFELRDSLAGQGHVPERLQFLSGRFRTLPEAKQKLLRGQFDMQLQFQTEVAELEKARTESTEALREIEAMRNARRSPGWLLLAFGLGSTIAGIVLLGLRLQPAVWISLLASGSVVLGTGIWLLKTGANLREADRENALSRLGDAQRRLNQIRIQRTESEKTLNETSRALGYRDAIELIRDWNEYVRLTEESTPVMRAQETLATLETQRKQVLQDAGALLARAGGGTPDPAHLERAAAGIRHHLAVRQRLAEMEKSWGWIDQEKGANQGAAAGLKERAIRILQSAGITYDAARGWPEHIAELSQRSRGRSRHTTLVDELIPQAQRRLLPEPTVEELKSQLDLLLAERGKGIAPAKGAAPPAARAQAEIEVETRKNREELEELQRKRSDLRLQVEEAWRKHHAEHPEKVAELERVGRALERARRFKHAIEIARETIQRVAHETHRRWAEYLNQRVTRILADLGAQVEELRFGEDLDFSVRFANSQPATRARAMLQLSTGARDQLYLALRLAISEYLSRGADPLPLLVDDAFATSDDERAREGMRLMLEHLSKSHQIIFVTCHRQRYVGFAEQDAALYGERVHWLDPVATSGVAPEQG